MSRYAPDVTIDTVLEYIAESTLLTICHGSPTTYEQAASTYLRASRVIDSGDFTISDGDVSGRKLVVAKQYGIVVTVYSSYTGCYLALCKVSDTTLRFVTDLNGYQTYALEVDQIINLYSFQIEIRDPIVPA